MWSQVKEIKNVGKSDWNSEACGLHRKGSRTKKGPWDRMGAIVYFIFYLQICFCQIQAIQELMKIHGQDPVSFQDVKVTFSFNLHNTR